MKARRGRDRTAALRTLLERAYADYDARWIEPDPVQFVWRYERTDDREVAGLIASSLAYGNVAQIKKSVEVVLGILGPRPARAIDALDAPRVLEALRGFKHRFNDATDVACLLVFLREMRRSGGSVEGFFSPSGEVRDIRVALESFVDRALALPRDGLYGKGPLPARAGVRFFFPSPKDGSACKRISLFLRWMVRADSVDPGGWTRVPRSSLLIPLDAHIINIGRSARLTRRVSPGWKMAEDITAALRACDPEDPVKYDFPLHRMGLFKREADLEALRRA
ncbi:MAG: TIGR02757 family protein [Vicinamibacteria bacterium]|nr:TIGR02757 family protein [Vicinamibacteria bacterium]